MAKIFDILKAIKTDIMSGVHGGGGDRFMTVRELADRFNVSLMTAQKVMAELKDESFLISDSTNPAIINPKRLRQAVLEKEVSSDRRIGVVMTNLASPFFSCLSSELQRASQNAGVVTMITGTGYSLIREKEIIDEFVKMGISRLLVVPGLDSACEDLYRQLIESGIRLVFLARRLDDVNADSVIVQNFQGGCDVAEHFWAMGYKTFGYIGRSSVLRKDPRLSGFAYSLASHDVRLAQEKIVQANGWSVEDGYEAMKCLMEQPNPPRAVFAYHDLLALGALRYCEDHGITVSGDVALAGFDDLPEVSIVSPPLTSISYPIASMASLAIQLVCNSSSQEDVEPHNIILTPKLIVRKSSDPAAKVEIAAGCPQLFEYHEIMKGE